MTAGNRALGEQDKFETRSFKNLGSQDFPKTYWFLSKDLPFVFLQVAFVVADLVLKCLGRHVTVARADRLVQAFRVAFNRSALESFSALGRTLENKNSQ